MVFIESVILGLIQGLTEFIPVSSSGHLVIAQNFFSGASNHLLLEWINIGTMLALFVYFRHRIMMIMRDVLIMRNMRLLRNIVLTSLPAGIVGYLAADAIGSSVFLGGVTIVAVMSAAVGIIMIVLEKLPKASPVANGEQLTKIRAIAIGVAQMIALIPGTSRSGATIIAGRLSGLSAKEAAEYSFLASLPIMVGVTLKVIVNDHEYLMANLDILIVGNIAAFISGLFAVGFLMRYLSNHSLAIFGWYRLGLAAVIVLVILLQ